MDSDMNHAKNRLTAMTRDEQQVNDLIQHVHNNMTDPFDIEACPISLINSATCLLVSKEVEYSLLNYVERGQNDDLTIL